MTNDEYWPENIDFALAGKTYDELTDEEKANNPLNIYRDEDEVLMAYSEHIIGIHQPVWVRVEKELDGREAAARRARQRRPHHLQPQHPAGSGICRTRG